MNKRIVRGKTFSKKKGQIFTAVKFHMWCPLVLLAKISWRQVGRSETKENKEMGSENFEHGAEERK
jgi:hypothetical protein